MAKRSRVPSPAKATRMVHETDRSPARKKHNYRSGQPPSVHPILRNLHQVINQQHIYVNSPSSNIISSSSGNHFFGQNNAPDLNQESNSKSSSFKPPSRTFPQIKAERLSQY